MVKTLKVRLIAMVWFLLSLFFGASVYLRCAHLTEAEECWRLLQEQQPHYPLDK